MSSSVTNSSPASGEGRIKVLPVQLVNKIAAGEVIERPASCVKELIENALDSQATEIEITVREGGKKLIRVVDNGNGIVCDDLPLVFKSHSTSKIVDESDLYNIRTFGFRGEALASMASVAQVRLVSKTAGQKEAYLMTNDEFLMPNNNDKITSSQPVAGVNGTTIEIANLFYQTPARRKFLKSDSVELSHISDMVTRFAIAYPEVSFSLINPALRAGAGQVIINLRKTPDSSSKSVMQRLAFFYGADIGDELIYAKEEQPARPSGGDGIKIEAYFSLPTHTRPTSKYQFFYLNRRFIKDRIISRAIYQSYHNLIPPGRYPFVVLFLEMPASAFDVNVHPTKIEVRFRDAWRLHDQIISLIRKSLSEKISDQPNPALADTGEDTSHVAKAGQGVMQALVDFFESKGTAGGPAKGEAFSEPSSTKNINTNSTNGTNPTPVRASYSPYSSDSCSHTGRTFQIHNSYIIDEVSDGVLIIDQHALHERILYNRLSKQIASSEIYKQRLLIPTVVEIPKVRMALLQEVVPYLKKVGIEIEEFGENAVAIQSAPSILNNINLKEFITEFIDAYADDPAHKLWAGDKSQNIKPIDNLIKMMACKGAIKAGDPLSPEEIKALLADSKGIDWVTCPHGRPAIHKITLQELGRFFQR